MKKNWLCLLLALCLALSLLPLSACAEFSDLQPGAYYLDAVDWAVEKGVTQGTTFTTFSPNATCTRAQIVTFLWRLFDAPKMFITNPFADVPTTEYYYNSAVWAYDRGVTDGTDETHFSPNLPCTRAHAVTFLYRALGAPAPKLTSSPFDDVQSAEAYFYNAVLWAAETGVTAGTDNTHFSPDAVCTRAQIVTFLYRAMHPQPMTTAIYLGVDGMGTSAAEGDLTAFHHRFFANGQELKCTIAADGGAYAFQNRLQQGEAYRIRLDDGVLTLVAEAEVSPKADAAGKKVWIVRTAAGGASVQTADTLSGKRFASDETNLYCLPSNAAPEPPVSGVPGVKTIKNFLQNALMPAGSTLYVYGGGWNWQDTGASDQARSVDLPESWRRFFAGQTSDYYYKGADPAASFYPWQGWNAYYYAGLDCSGYVGWAVYRTLNTSSGGEGYVLSASKMAKNYAERGLGSVTDSAANLRPGDVVSISGHVWICLGRCEDGSVVILHSTPSESRTGRKGGGVQIGALGPDTNCEAYRLADRYMAENCPVWYLRYAPALRSLGGYTADCSVFSWSGSVLADPDGLRSKTAAEVLQILFRDA